MSLDPLHFILFLFTPQNKQTTKQQEAQKT
jgi:hypothetical protein